MNTGIIPTQESQLTFIFSRIFFLVDIAAVKCWLLKTNIIISNLIIPKSFVDMKIFLIDNSAISIDNRASLRFTSVNERHLRLCACAPYQPVLSTELRRHPHRGNVTTTTLSTTEYRLYFDKNKVLFKLGVMMKQCRKFFQVFQLCLHRNKVDNRLCYVSCWLVIGSQMSLHLKMIQIE